MKEGITLSEDVRSKYGAVDGSKLNGAPPILPFSISVEGQEGTGKSQFGLLTCPTPIVHINFGDRDATAFLYDMSEDRRSKTTLYSFAPSGPDGWTRAEAKQSLLGLSDIAKSELADNKLAGGTFILDSGSSWWDSVQEVYVAPLEEERDAEGKKRSGGLIYGKGNLVVSGVVSWIKNQGCFFVLTHQKSQSWDSQGPIPGQYKARINSKVPYLVEIRLDLRLECVSCAVKSPIVGEQDCRKQGHIGRNHVARIIKFGRSTALIGVEFSNSDISFSNIYSLYARGDFPGQERLV
ncbi:hypothetical protein LCGC14_0310880 [marine sediment metagenome]|uniref:RecA family profile 2 domain-containing protein n=1 Tax=marine sediment metagenome TaxID=412755 RepID=A0A0F9TMC9_9ZZZZ